jgi:hypothetical protein
MGEQPVPLRLMSQPLYRFADEATGLVDGALFAYTETTDPEAVLILEAIRPEGDQASLWRFTIAKMTSRPTFARRQEKNVWSAPSYWLNPRSPNDPYQERQLSVYPPPIK